jgi:hypothetical protein
MVIRPPVVVKKPVIRSAHGHQCSELSSVPYPVMLPPSTANLDDNSNIKLTEAVVALSVVVRRANCA